MRVNLFLSRLVFRKPYNRPSGEGNTPLLVPTAPPFPQRGHGPTDLSSVFKYRLLIESIGISKVGSLSLLLLKCNDFLQNLDTSKALPLAIFPSIVYNHI